jgi:branched-chain amino acid transport system substrate-binding protein
MKAKPSLIKLIILMAFLLNITACKKDNETENSPVIEIKVAGLLGLSGALSNLGTTSKTALEIAVKKINDDFASKNSPYRLKLQIYDTQLDTLIALPLIKSLASDGYRLFIGPMTSTELASIKPFADSMGLLVVSSTSTSKSLIIPNDAIFRYCPGEQIVINALSNTIYLSGKQAMITIARNDIATLGLQTSFTTTFSGLGGTVISAGSYPASTTNFTSTLNDLRTQIQNLSTNYSRSQIGIFYPSFNEAIQLFHEASGDSILSSVNWYGTVGFIKAPGLLTDTMAASFAYATHYFSPEPGLPNSAQNIWQPLQAEILNGCGLEPDFYAFAAYDILNVMAKMVEQNNGIPTDGAQLQNQFLSVSNQSSGATGTIVLNAEGDRNNGIFNYWGLSNSNSTYTWTIVGQSQ